jgi:transcriptional regulator with XRE-family HTH domain
VTPHPVYKQIGATIQQRRKQLGLKQVNVAAGLGISRGSLANVETGRQSILVHQLYKFAEILQLLPADLLPSTASPAPLKNDWSTKLPAGLKPQQQEQIARLLEGSSTDPVTPTKGNNAKSKKR